MTDSIGINAHEKPKHTQRIMLDMTAWICGAAVPQRGAKTNPMFVSYYN